MGLPFLSKLSAQTDSDSLFHHPERIISPIPSGIIDLEVDQEGNLFLLQPEKHKLHKFFRATGYDSVLTIGGKGIGREGFNYPTKIDVPNRQFCFMLDYMNRRLVHFNTNLKVIRDINFLTLQIDVQEADVEFLWPISFAAGPSGELFLLNQEDIRIYKITAEGQLLRTFGGLDYGTGSLIDPWDIKINDQNYVFAIDSSEQRVSIYDLFGTFQYNLQFPLPFRWTHMTVYGQNLLFFDAHHLFIYNTFSKKGETVHFRESEGIRDIAATRDYIYILFEKKVHLYKLGRSK